MKKTFEELKNILLAKAKKEDACGSEYRRAASATTEAELLSVIKDNLHWCTDHKIIDEEYFKDFNLETYVASGVANTGEDNKGFANAGHDNAGNRNAGAFNSVSAPYMMFNKPSSWTYNDFINSEAFRLLNSISTTMWVSSSHMCEEERKSYPYHETTGGYIKNIPFKEAFVNAWGNWSEENRKEFTSLENFDKEIFFEITGIKI